MKRKKKEIAKPKREEVIIESKQFKQTLCIDLTKRRKA